MNSKQRRKKERLKIRSTAKLKAACCGLKEAMSAQYKDIAFTISKPAYLDFL